MVGSAYLCMAGLMALGIVTILMIPEPEAAQGGAAVDGGGGLGTTVRISVAPYGAGAAGIDRPLQTGRCVCRRVDDVVPAARDGFSSEDIGLVRAFGIGATILGAFIGGGLMPQLGLFRSLMVFGVLQALSNLSFLWLAWAGKSYAVMAFAVGFENLTGGMGTAAFVALVMSLCNHRYTATQFALLSSVEALGRVFPRLARREAGGGGRVGAVLLRDLPRRTAGPLAVVVPPKAGHAACGAERR
jgi:PAT family beta-lactamase induction signal transducer AmpG